MAEGWDFTVDSDIQRTLASNLDKNADTFDARVDDLYKKIDSMGTNNYWVGEDYDAFKNGTEGYKTALQDLSNGIRLFSDHFEKVAEGTDTLATDLISVVVNATGTSNIGNLNGGSSNAGANLNSPGTNTSGDTTTNTDTSSNNGTATNPTDTNTNSSMPAGSTGTNTNDGTTTGVVGTDSNDSDNVIIEGSESNSTNGESTNSTTGGNDATSPILDNNANGGEDQIEGTPSTNGSINALEPDQSNGYGSVDSSAGTIDNSQETQEVYIDHDFTESFSNNNYWQTMGEDFANDWNAFTNHDDFGSIIAGAALGPINLAVDTVQLAGNAAIDGTNDAIEAVEWALWGDYSGYETTTEPTTEASSFTNPYNSGYWSHLGDNFADDWDYSECDGIMDYVTATGEGVVGTIWDAVGVVGHGILDTVQGGLECVEWVINLF